MHAGEGMHACARYMRVCSVAAGIALQWLFDAWCTRLHVRSIKACRITIEMLLSSPESCLIHVCAPPTPSPEWLGVVKE